MITDRSATPVRNRRRPSFCRRSCIAGPILAGTILVLAVSIFAGGIALAFWPSDPTVNVPLCSAVHDQVSTGMVEDGAGGAIAAWVDGRDGPTRGIYAQRVDAAGDIQWMTDGIALCTTTASINANAPTLISDGAGGAIVTWVDIRNGNQDIYAQWVDATGSPQWTPEGVALCAAADNQIVPRIVSDGAGGAIVAWYDYRTQPYSDIYIQRVDAQGVPQWTADGVALCTADGYQYQPRLVSDGEGGAIVSWWDFRVSGADIYAQRVNAAGLPQWTTDGVPLCTAPGEQVYMESIPDGAGGAIVSWNDWRPGGDARYSDIYAQRVDASGATRWATDGVALCAAQGAQSGIALVPDGTGGAIVAWADARGPDVSDIYAQRVNGDGVPQWTSDGIAVCSAVSDQGNLVMASDGEGGGIVSWQDPRGGLNYDIYAQRMDSNGIMRWTANGVPICRASGNQVVPAMVSDSRGGAIVAWYDGRNASYDVYAQRILGAGSLPTLDVSSVQPGRFQLSIPAPNPSRGSASLILVMSERIHVRVEVLDVFGRIFAVIMDEELESGRHELRWDGRESSGLEAAAGAYFIRARSNGKTLARRLVLTR